MPFAMAIFSYDGGLVHHFVVSHYHLPSSSVEMLVVMDILIQKYIFKINGRQFNHLSIQ